MLSPITPSHDLYHIYDLSPLNILRHFHRSRPAHINVLYATSSQLLAPLKELHDYAFRGEFDWLYDYDTPNRLRCIVDYDAPPICQRVAATLETALTVNNFQLTPDTVFLLIWLLERNFGVLFCTVSSGEPIPVRDLKLVNSSTIVTRANYVCPTIEGDLLRIKVNRTQIRRVLGVANEAKADSILEIPTGGDTTEEKVFWRPKSKALLNWMQKKDILVDANPVDDQEAGIFVPPYKTVKGSVQISYSPSEPAMGWSFKRSYKCPTCHHNVDVLKSTSRRHISTRAVADMRKIWETTQCDTPIENTLIVHHNLTNNAVLIRVVEIVCDLISQVGLPESLLERVIDIYATHSLLRIRPILLETCLLIRKCKGSRRICTVLRNGLSVAYQSWSSRRRVIYFFVQYVVNHSAYGEPSKLIFWTWIKECLQAAAYAFHSEHQQTPDDNCCRADSCIEFIMDTLWMLVSESNTLALEALQCLEETEKALLKCSSCISILRCFNAQMKFRNVLVSITDKIKSQQRMDTADLKTTRLRDVLLQSTSTIPGMMRLDNSESTNGLISSENITYSLEEVKAWFSRCSITNSDAYQPRDSHFPLPLQPRQSFRSLNCERSLIIRSSKYPMLVNCHTNESCVSSISTCSHDLQQIPVKDSDSMYKNSYEKIDEKSCASNLIISVSSSSSSDFSNVDKARQSFDDDNWTLNLNSSHSVSGSPARPEDDWEMLEDAVKTPVIPASSSLIPSSPRSSGYRFLHKMEDDVRQDCLMTECFRFVKFELFDKMPNIPTHLSPYKVLPLSKREGFIEYVDGSMAFSSLGKENPPLTQILRTSKTLPPEYPFSFLGDQRLRFMESLAGYCLMTYIFSVGDRHLDNLMVCADGSMFHVDYGFILGSDPKPFAKVPMRLTGDMHSALGNQLFISFVIRVITLWFFMRKESAELKVLFELLVRSTIPDLMKMRQNELKKEVDETGNPLAIDSTEILDSHIFASRILARLIGRKDDLGCIQYLINEVVLRSLTSIAPTIADFLHNWVLYFK